jgi:hypothetical protein
MRTARRRRGVLEAITLLALTSRWRIRLSWRKARASARSRASRRRSSLLSLDELAREERPASQSAEVVRASDARMLQLGEDGELPPGLREILLRQGRIVKELERQFLPQVAVADEEDPGRSPAADLSKALVAWTEVDGHVKKH